MLMSRKEKLEKEPLTIHQDFKRLLGGTAESFSLNSVEDPFDYFFGTGCLLFLLQTTHLTNEI